MQSGYSEALARQIINNEVTPEEAQKLKEEEAAKAEAEAAKAEAEAAEAEAETEVAEAEAETKEEIGGEYTASESTKQSWVNVGAFGETHVGPTGKETIGPTEPEATKIDPHTKILKAIAEIISYFFIKEFKLL